MEARLSFQHQLCNCQAFRQMLRYQLRKTCFLQTGCPKIGLAGHNRVLQDNILQQAGKCARRKLACKLPSQQAGIPCCLGDVPLGPSDLLWTMLGRSDPGDDPGRAWQLQTLPSQYLATPTPLCRAAPKSWEIIFMVKIREFQAERHAACQIVDHCCIS